MPKGPRDHEAETGLGIETSQGHPLFPASEEDGKVIVVDFIQITRFESGVPVLVPRVFRADEIRSEAQLTELFGGGVYEVIARRQMKLNPDLPGAITGRKRFKLPGVSGSLTGDPKDAPQGSIPKPAPEASGVAPAPNGMGLTGGSDSLLGMILQMNMQATQRAAEQQAMQQQQFLQMMTAMIGSGKSESTTLLTTVLNIQAQSNQTMAGLISAILSNRGGGTNVDEMTKILELAKKLNGDVDEEDDLSSTIEAVGGLMKSAAQLQQGPPQGVTVDPSLVGPGSAASLLEPKK